MIIKKIMLIIAIVMLVTGLTLAGIKIAHHWNTCKWLLLGIGILGLILNTGIWIGVSTDNYVEKGDKYYPWHCINLTIYTAGLYWLGYGIYKLWDNAEEIEHSVKVFIVRRKNEKELKKASEGALALSENQTRAGALSFAKKQAGELSVK